MKTAASHSRPASWWAWTACLDGMFLSSAVVTVSYMLNERDGRSRMPATQGDAFLPPTRDR
jgi:hypothetical protein